MGLPAVHEFPSWRGASHRPSASLGLGPVSASTGLAPAPSCRPAPRIQHEQALGEQQADERRAQRFALATQRWQHSHPATTAHNLLDRRLSGDATPQLLGRIDLRSSRDRLGEHLILRLQHPEHGHTGFQQVYARALDNQGRTQHLVIRAAGLKSGSSAVIQAVPGHEHWPAAICEGLFTALSVALGWPGPVVVALDAYNLRPVRAAFNRPCLFFADDDRQGKHNTGFEQARRALQPGDRILLPQFPAGEQSGSLSDFNDLHRLCGLAEVQRQIRAVWPMELQP